MRASYLSPEYSVGSVPSIGHGNPGALFSHKELTKRELGHDYPYYLAIPHIASKIGAKLHILMTVSERLRQMYARSEEVRNSSFANLYGAFLFWNVMSIISDIPEYSEAIYGNWNVVQEHMLAGASQEQLLRLHFKKIQLLIPDVRPKESALATASKHPQIEMVTWNKQTYDNLAADGYTIVYKAPTLVQGLTSQEYYENIAEPNRGIDIVMKSSGSGMPPEMRDVILAALRQQNLTWEYHHPHGVIGSYGSREFSLKNNNTEKLLQRFYESLGGKTKILICYPSEMAQAITELYQRGCTQMQVLLLPPRGQHEVINLQYLWDTYGSIGLITGVLVRKVADAVPAGIPKIPLAAIGTMLAR